MTDWGASYSPEWRLYRVDEATWADADMLGAFSEATIDRSDESTMESGSFTIDMGVSDEVGQGYYRLAMIARQEGGAERVDVATLYCAATGGEIDRGLDKRKVTGKSVLYPASKCGMPIAGTAPAGCDGVEWAAELLNGVLAREVAAYGSFTLDTGMSFAPQVSKLDAARQVLDAGGWCIQVDGRGEVSLLEKPDAPSLSLDEAHASLLMPKVSYELDYTGVPNRYRAQEGSDYAEAVNDDPGSPTSTATRGFIDDGGVFDTSPQRVNGETLHAYCERKLAEASIVRDVRTYSREYFPGVHPFSAVSGSLARVGLEGPMRVAKQRISCDEGILVTEQACKEVATWTA